MDYTSTKNMVLSELETVLSLVDEKSVNEFIEMLETTGRVFVVGVGRTQLSLLALVKRLNHLGIDATYVGAVNEPAITEKDLLIVGSGSGETAIPVAIAKIAKKYNAKIVHIGSNAQSAVSSMADLMIRIPCRTKLALESEVDSKQPMSSLFEQSLLLFSDIVACMIVQRNKINIKELWHTHANLE